MKNFNDEARKLISDYQKDIKIPFDLKINILTEKIFNLQLDGNQESEILTNYLYSILYLDAYKLLSWKSKENKLTPFRESEFSLLYNIQDHEELTFELAYNNELLKRMIIATYEVALMDDLNKIILMKSLSAGENMYLEEKWPIHKLDMETYNQEINIDALITLMKEKYKKSNSISYPFEHATLFSISGFLKNLLKYDFNNALDLFQRIALIDYSIATYLREKKCIDEAFESHLNFYNNAEYGKIMNVLMTNQEFLWLCIESLQNLYIEKKYKDIILSEEILSRKENDSMRRKLNVGRKEE